MTTNTTPEQRVAMSYEFEDLLARLGSKKEKSESQTEKQRMDKLNEILCESVKTFDLQISGNNTTKYDFILSELNVSLPNTIENCSIEIFDGIERLKTELDLIDHANAVIDIDSSDSSNLTCALNISEKSRLTATIGATHDMNEMSQLNGSMSVGIRNLFGNGEKLDLSADLGLSALSNMVNPKSLINNTSNQYSITLHKPRMPRLPHNTSLLLQGFQQKLDRVRSSSYTEESLGIVASLLSANGHSLSYNYCLRSYNNRLMSTKSSLAYKFISDERNHLSIPSEGHLLKTELELAGIGGDVDFVKALCTLNYHLSLPPIVTNDTTIDFGVESANFSHKNKFQSILNIGFQTGIVLPWKGNDKHIRVIDRIVPFGGLQLRGFEHAQIGPKDRNDYVHCDFLFNAGISLNTKLFQSLYSNLFFNLSYSNLLRNPQRNMTNASYGLSALIPFPVGRFEFGYAYPINNNNNNPFSPWFWAFDVQFF